MSNQKTSSVGWTFWFQWVLANTVGLVVGLIVGFVGLLIHGAFFGAIIGTLMGIMQWCVLREYISRAGSWAAACTAGGAVGGLVYEAFARADLAEVTIARAFGGVVLGALVGGFVAGAIQWLVLRQQVYRTGWWVLASTVGGAMAFAVGGAVGGAMAWSVGWIGVEFLRQNIPGGMPAAEDGMRHLEDCGRARGPRCGWGRGWGDCGACADLAVATTSLGGAVRCSRCPPLAWR